MEGVERIATLLFDIYGKHKGIERRLGPLEALWRRIPKVLLIR